MEHSADIWTAFFKTGAVLSFVIALLFFLLYILKRFSNLNIVKSKHNHIKIVAVHHFSPREKVVLIEVMGKTFLLGVTANNIQTLAAIDNKNNSDNNNFYHAAKIAAEDKIDGSGNIYDNAEESKY